MKMGEVEDDEVRTSVATGSSGSQVRTEKPFDWARYL
jgi:hypothetical protein